MSLNNLIWSVGYGHYLTHWSRNKMDAILQTTFQIHFLNENIQIFNVIKISPTFVPNDILALFQIVTWRRPGDKQLSEPMMVSLRPRWVNSVISNIDMLGTCGNFMLTWLHLNWILNTNSITFIIIAIIIVYSNHHHCMYCFIEIFVVCG